MRLIKHILSALMLLTLLSASAGIMPQEASKPFAKHGDILSENMLIASNQMKNGNFLSDIITDRLEREAMRRQMRGDGTKENSNLNKKEGEKLYTVKCIFKGEIEPYFAIYNTDFFMESLNRVWDESEELDTYYFQVPEGIYDVYAEYWSTAEHMEGWGNLVHEEVIVNADTEVEFTADELTEKIIFKPLLRDGQEVVLPTFNIIDQEPYYEYDYTDATANALTHTYIFFREGCENLKTSGRVLSSKEELTFLSNKLSEKYHLISQYNIINRNEEIEISTTDIIGAKGGVVSNYIKDFVKYPVPSFSKTPDYISGNIDRGKTCVMGYIWYNNVSKAGYGLYVDNYNPEVFYTTQSIDKNIDIKTPLLVKNVQGDTIINNGKYSRVVRQNIITLPAIYDGNNWQYINQNHSECGNYSYQKPEKGPIVEYPGVPGYCYFADEITQPIGNSSPVLVTMSGINELPNATIFFIDPQAFIGRYGEVRDCDMWTLHTLINLNGNIAFDSDSGEYLENWCIQNSLDGHEKGLLEATFTNRNVLIDETIPGFNITTIKVDERNEDLCTPTTQMLIFKNTDGAITDRFSSGEEGLIEFSAGDFNWVSEGAYYTCEEADIKVEYAPYGEESFMPLKVEEIPENYYMPGFGYFYRGSLADVTMPSSNGWYDVRFTLTDKAGNEMVQHISPAFKIDKNTSVGEEAIDGIKVWSIDGKILAAGSDIESMALYSADGKLIASANGSSLPTNGYRGIGIVKVTSTTGTTTHKTVIR